MIGWVVVAVGWVVAMAVGWGILLDGSRRARQQERAVNEWLRQQGKDPIYPE